MELLMFLKAEDDLEILLFTAVVQEAVVPDYVDKFQAIKKEADERKKEICSCWKGKNMIP